jgi:predicted DNA-binding transcriptional regulator YafY
VQWVLGFGAFARVIGPPELIEQVQQQAREVLDSYKKPAA